LLRRHAEAPRNGAAELGYLAGNANKNGNVRYEPDLTSLSIRNVHAALKEPLRVHAAGANGIRRR
jgi:hypothetical protein